MARTLSQILIDVNATLDLEATAPSGTEQVVRANYANQAVWDAAATGQLSEFKRETLINTSTLATIPMPSDYRELQENPRILDSSGQWQEWEVIEIEQKYDKSSADRYVYQMGDPAGGYNLIFNNIISAATLSIIYQRFPSGLLTLTDTSELPDPQYIVRQIESYVLYSRSDARFPVAEQKAESKLANMMGREMKSTTGQVRSTKMLFRHPLRK